MHIKRITIKGFKTYRNETIIDDLSPHDNVVIGSNGSGKSNLFAAIRFVLSDDYSNLRREDRQGLIHQGSIGTSIMSASVEIIFSDPEGRVMLGSFGIAPRPNNEISVRRTVGLKKDDYQINDRNVTRSELSRVLESAGFSMNNPYNIVPQGKIIALTNAKDSERLKLLEEVVGAKSFEVKLNASLKKMNETDFKMKQIQDELRELKSKMDEMNDERLELEKYNDLERQRKALQFTLYDRELETVIGEIEGLDDKYNSTFVDSKQYVQELDKREELVAQINATLLSIENELKVKTKTDYQQARTMHNEISNRIEDANVRISDFRSQIRDYNEQKQINTNSLDIIEEEIAKKQETLDKQLPRFNSLTKDEEQLKLKLLQLEQKRRTLLLKRGRYAEFNSKQERDKWINSEIGRQTETLNELKSSMTTCEGEYDQQKRLLEELDSEIVELNDSVYGPGITAELDDLTHEQDRLKQEYAQKIDERKELWRTEQKLVSLLENTANDIKVSQRNVNETINRGLSTGLSNVKEITDKLKLSSESVFGTVGELIKVSEKYKVCAEVIGGNSLFHVVVDTDATASILMQELYRIKGGRVTFIPLNKITADTSITFPPTGGDGPDSPAFTPLIKKIKFDPKFEKAVRHIFGRTIVVKELAQGMKLAKKYNLTAITLDGDRADRKGTLTGGYYDHYKNNKLDSLKKLREARKSHSVTSQKLESVREKLQGIDSEIDNLNGSLRDCSLRKESILTDLEKLRTKLNIKKSDRMEQEEVLTALVLKREKLTTSIRVVNEAISSYQKDLQKEFGDDALSGESKRELKSVDDLIAKTSNDLAVTTDSLENLTSNINVLKAELESKLIPQRDYLSQKVSESGEERISELQKELDATLNNLQELNAQKESIDNNLSEIQAEIDRLSSEKLSNERNLESANSQQRALLKRIENFQKSAEKALIRRTTLAARSEELKQKIREVGFLSEDVLRNFSKMKSEDLLAKLNDVNTGISKLTNVNKRAFENFRKFDEKQAELIERSKELVVAKQSIQKLIEKLKAQKASAVDKTFRMVSENFSAVFEKLVPKGTGRLIIYNTPPNDNGSTTTQGSSFTSGSDGTQLYTGVSIAVSFNSKQDEQLNVEQLSGGQKTVCAIALILAIQMVDPAPFYLFDEIDAALDKQYRSSVASTIKDLSRNAQFICTTFRSDMLRVADKFFRVKYENKISTVVEISREDALRITGGGNRDL